MMLYKSEIVKDVMHKQGVADATLERFSVEVRDAIALAEHFGNIHPEDYVVPSKFSSMEIIEPQAISTVANTRFGNYSRL